ncbi:hypothetical protein [Nonomuraea angiospora]|uniref:hypothetical protein n=1 Tax=Nonomuraea angiospora TaxID=46172 RepID=UPI0029BB8B3F|nr:hypothetical protein [Nonomuraea angiospora]MDX3100443.1 hypothetical protein [Nonomuraea angiospora]
MTKRSYTSRTNQQSGSAGLPTQEFDLDDITWVCESNVSVLDLSEYARLAQQGVTAESSEGAAILADVFSGLLGSNYQRFRLHCRKNGTEPGVLVEILRDLISDAAQRPTQRPSDSFDGPPPGEATSKVVSLSRGVVSVQPLSPAPTAGKPQPQEEKPRMVSYG